MSTVITVENLGKRYTLHHQQREQYTALRDVITNGVRTFSKKIFSPFTTHTSPVPAEEDFWALKDVSFEVNQGDRIGIIGRNGAGKSTLLKILSRITEPTTGSVRIKGRVASLLEVGTGFHPELTGRENIFLNGAILGMGRVEIKKKFDEIVEFAEIEKFLDTPVKRYSSGMYVRLAFAVAAHLEPEILIVDEVLAVGDAQFQKKCLGKMEDVSAREGRTVLFVSHNMTALKSLCSRAMWLNAGQMIDDGETCKIVTNYLQNGAYKTLEQAWNSNENAPGNDKVRLRRVCIIPESDDESEITVETPLRMEFEFWNSIPETKLSFSMHLYNAEGLCIINSGSKFFSGSDGLIKGTCYIPGNFLNDGIYRVMIIIVKDGSMHLYSHNDVLIFEVHDIERQGAWYGKWPGVVRPDFKWTVEQN
ncbi:MAG: ABC transporter ATP-binding protein [Desulfuromonadales bacterium]